MAHIYILNNQPSLRVALRRAVQAQGHQAHTVSSPTDLAARGDQAIDLLIADLDSLPDLDLEQTVPDVPADHIVITTGRPDSAGAHRVRSAGVFACLPKPLDFEALGEVVERCLRGSSPQRAQVFADATPPAAGEMVYASGSMQTLMLQVEQVANHDVTVLIQGESGTGKELVARALHERGDKAGRPFVAVNCGAIPDELLESELFGHERGSFTDAGRTRKGRFELAGRGTLFLDEIGEMSTKLQVKLLRALQEREIQRVGGETTLPVRARIVTATNRDLQSEVEAGRFREDLLHRLKVVALVVPPLRDRPEDLRALASAFLARFAQELGKPVRGISSAAWDRLSSHPWPGNVRELEHVLQRATVFARGPILEESDLPELAETTAAPPWERSLRAHVARRIAGGDPPAQVQEEVLARTQEIFLEASSGDKSDSVE